jgi:broad specificity phosphatase PhoE
MLSKEIKAEALKFFQSEIYRSPSREDLGYIANFYTFMGSARKSLEELLLKLLPSLPNVTDLADIEAVFDAHGDTSTNAFGLLTGHSGGALSDEGIKTARSFYHQRPSLIISSDLPRALDHALAKYDKDDKLGSRLAKLRESVPATLKHNNGMLKKEDQLEWLSLALDFGIIPTPLLRAQYYGPMELFPEKYDEKKVKAALEESQHVLEGLDQAELEKGLRNRKDPHYVMMVNEMQVTENREALMTRVNYILRLFAPEGSLHEHSKGKRIQFVSHSGVHDVVLEYLRHFQHIDEILLKRREKQAQRGESFSVKLDAVVQKGIPVTMYLNDPAYFVDVLRNTEQRVKFSLQASLDEKVKDGAGVLETRLIRWQKELKPKTEEAPYRPIETSIYDHLKDKESILVLGDPGQGKTIFAADLAQKLKGRRDSKKNYVPILNALRRLSAELDEQVRSGEKVTKDLITKSIFGSVLKHGNKVVDALLKEYRPVFILEGYDESSSDYGSLIHAAVKDLNKYGPVVVTSRLSGFNKYENHDYMTLNIDPNFAMYTIDEYLEQRIKSKTEVEKFKEFLQSYDTSVTTNSLMIFFLTRLYNKGELNLKNPQSSTQIYESIAKSTLLEHEFMRGAHWSEADKAGIVDQRMKMLSEIAFQMTAYGRTFSHQDLLSEKWKEPVK